MDYQKMWENLKQQIARDVTYHRMGAMQTMEEAVYGEAINKGILAIMARIEEEEGKKE